MAAGHSYLIQQVPGLEHVAPHVSMAVAIGGVLVATTLVARAQVVRAMKSPGGGLVPDAKMTYKNFFEIVAEKLYGFVESTIGKEEAPHFFPLIGTIFLFILTMNWIGMAPGMAAATENMNTTLAMGAFVFLYYNFVGIKHHGLGYLKHFFGPVVWLAPLMLIVELASHIFRPISLGLRLRSVIMADHQVFYAFNDLVPVLVPVVFLMLGAFVGLIQAVVFSLMTMVYISLAASHDH
jgi:F-type H+-transporting ATPase subunit a